MDHGRRRPAQAAARLRSGRPAEGGVGAERADPARAGPLVSGRTVAALADCAVLAHRRATAVDRRRAAGRPLDVEPVGPPSTTRRPTRCSPGSPTAWDCRCRRCGRLRGPAGPAGGQGAPARGRPGGPRRRPRPADDSRRPRRAAGPPRRIHHGPSGFRAAAAPPRRRPRLGQRQLAAAPRPHRVAATAILRRACGCRWIRSAGDRRAPSFDADPQTVGDALSTESGDAVVEDPDTAPPTAMVAEVRDGLLYVFMPPTEALEHFVDLIARVEAAAAKADCPVVIEGYGPPPDPRLQSTTITPDPGVIEVNVAPTASFAEQTPAARNPVRKRPAGSFVHRVIRRRRHPRRHRRRQPHHPRRRHARGLTAAAPAGPVGLAADVLAAAPVAVLSVRRAIRRHHVAGAPGRRGPRRGAVRTRDRVRRDRPAGRRVAPPNRG